MSDLELLQLFLGFSRQYVNLENAECVCSGEELSLLSWESQQKTSTLRRVRKGEWLLMAVPCQI